MLSLLHLLLLLSDDGVDLLGLLVLSLGMRLNLGLLVERLQLVVPVLNLAQVISQLSISLVHELLLSLDSLNLMMLVEHLQHLLRSLLLLDVIEQLLPQLELLVCDLLVLGHLVLLKHLVSLLNLSHLHVVLALHHLVLNLLSHKVLSQVISGNVLESVEFLLPEYFLNGHLRL